MFSRPTFLPLACSATLAFAQSPLRANVGGYNYGVYQSGSAGAPSTDVLKLFEPKNIDQVEMQTEKLNIDLHVEYADVTVEYTLHNPGQAVSVEAGFPFTNIDQEGSSVWKATGVQNFQFIVDGKPIATREIDGTPSESPNSREVGPMEAFGARLIGHWQIFKIDFKKGQTRTAKVSYTVRYAGSEIGTTNDIGIDEDTLTYLFSSAALWKGPIKEGTVTIRAVTADPDLIKLNLASRFQRFDRLWQWNFKDFEPTLADDLQIVVRPATSRRDDYHFGSEGKWESRAYDYDITASSTLEGKYGAENLKLNYESTGPWAEGAADDGLGESLTLTLNKARKISAIGIINGFAESEALYRANNRVAEFAVSINGGKPFTAEIPDERLEREYFRISLPKDTPAVKTIKLVIQKIYPGAKYRDTCVTRIQLVTPLSKEPKFQPSR